MTEIEKEIFIQLLEYSNELEKDQKYLIKEDPVAFRKLLKFLVIIENNLHWEIKNDYVKLIESFLNGIVSEDEFSIIFIRMYEEVNEKLQGLKQDFQSSEISKLLVKGKACGIGDLLSRLYGDCDSFNPDSSSRTDIQLDEDELRNCAKRALLEIQKYLDE